jgi:hypothetical protein
MSSCFITRQPGGIRVDTKEGNESQLYRRILDHITEGYKPTSTIELAATEGLIQDASSVAEGALFYWGLAHTKRVQDALKAIGDGAFDKNGEPLFSMVAPLIGLSADGKPAVQQISASGLGQFLNQEGLVQKKDGRFWLSNKQTDTEEKNDQGEEGKKTQGVRNLERIQKILKFLGLPQGALSFKRENGKVSVNFSGDSFQAADPENAKDRTHAQSLIEFLQDRFPQLKIGFISVDQAKAKWQHIQNMMPAERRRNVDFDKVKSFIYKDEVFLVEGRVDDRTAVEEVLHPFIYTLAKENKELFQQLVAAAKKDFPNLYDSTKWQYTKEAGFKESDIEQELVAKALGKVFQGEREQNKATSVMKLLQQVLDWFADLVKDFGILMGGKGFVINTRLFPKNGSLTQLAQLLNTYDSQFLVDTSSPLIHYSLSDEQEEFFNKLKERVKGNPLLLKIIDDMLITRRKLHFDQAAHRYSTAGRDFMSTTTAINGIFDDDTGKYELNRIFGNQLDQIMESLVLGVKWEHIKEKVSHINIALAERVYEQFQGYIDGLITQGAIVIPQFALYDPISGIAGTMDLLVIRPDGTKTIIDLKVSKNEMREDGYQNSLHAVRKGARLKEGEKLSKRQRHGIQIGCYKRLMEINGHYVEQTQTYHVWADIEGEGKDQVVKRFVVEGAHEHYPSENRSYVDQIIPTRPGDDKLKKYKEELGYTKLTEDWDSVDEETRQSDKYQSMLDRLQVKMEDFAEQIRKNINRMESIKSIAQSKDAVQKLSALLATMQGNLSRRQADQAFGAFLRYARQELTDLKSYLSEAVNMDDPAFIQRVLDGDMYMKTFWGLVNAPMWGLNNPHQKAMIAEIQDLLVDTQDLVKSSLMDYMTVRFKELSTRNLDSADWKSIMQKYEEISGLDQYLGDTATSIDPLIALADKMYKFSQMQAVDEALQLQREANEKQAMLQSAQGGTLNFDFMYETDSKGKKTGKIIQKIGAQFWNVLNEVREKILDAEGKVKKYRKIENLSEANPEDIAYNKEVYKGKQEWREFSAPEDLSEAKPKDGNYYKLAQELKDERMKCEIYHPPYVNDKGRQVKGYWKKDPDVPYDKWLAFKTKYYNSVQGYEMPTMDEATGTFTGATIRNTGVSWFPKQEYVEIREEAADGTSMLNPKWQALQNPTNERGQAEKDVYEWYVKKWEALLSTLPATAQRELMKRLPIMEASFLEQVKQSPDFLKLATKGISNFFDIRSYPKSSPNSDDGTFGQQIPIFYIDRLQDEKRVKKLTDSIEQLDKDYNAKQVPRKEYLKDRKRLSNQLRLEKKRVTATEIAPNFFEGLKDFGLKVYSHKHKQAIEGSLLAVDKLLEQRTYKKTNSFGIVQEDDATGEAKTVAGDKSRSSKRYRDWLEMVFYNSSDIDNGSLDKLAKKVMAIASRENIGWNGLGPIHNLAMARINTMIETLGARFYSRQSAIRATLAYNTEFLPGWLTSIGASKDGYYLDKKKPGSKYEAFVRMFNMMRSNTGEGGGGLLDYTSYGYLGSNIGEYNAQSKSGMSYIMDYELKSTDPKGAVKSLSIYDAYDFDHSTGELKIKDGFKALSDQERFGITNYIWEMNKQIHGNYAWEDRMVIQKYALGQLAAQFHKFVYPMYKTRFKPLYYDENLGDIEGRYLTVYHFVKFWHEAEGHWWAKAKTAWHDLTPNQIKNMHRNFAELGFLAMSIASYSVLRGVANGLGPDHDKMKHWINYLSWESSRQAKEMLFWIPVIGTSAQVELIKNPFAVGSTYTRFADVIAETVKLTWNTDDDYYTSGPFKDQLKLKKKALDLVPIFKDINRWSNFSQVSSFYVN